MKAPFARVLRNGDIGPDVDGVGRGLCRAGFFIPISAYNKLGAAVRRGYGSRKEEAVVALRKEHGLGTSKFYDRKVHAVLNDLDAFDAKAVTLIKSYEPLPPPPEMVFPLPKGVTSSICQEWHETSGIPGNWAFDFCAGPGSAILAPEAMKLTRLSGHPPGDDELDAAGIFGWSQYFETADGYVYYVTHEGLRDTDLGQRFKAGQIIGRIGDQHFRPDHVHVGITSPKGEADAKSRIAKVSKSPKVTAIP
jgi:hypothetical protein